MGPRITLFTAIATLLLGCGGGDPEITLVSPERVSARGGETLTLRGAGFAAGAAVTVGGEPATGVQVISEGEIRCTTPLLFAGPATVTVDLPEGDRASRSGALTVLPLDLRFTEAPAHSLSLDPTIPLAGAALGDFDGDGDPDLVTGAAGAPCRFLENDGRGNFTDAPKGKKGPRFPASTPDTRVVLAADFDGDGALDLFLGLGSEGPGLVYRNDGTGTFTDTGPLTLIADADPATAAAAGDIDGDGRVDLVIANDAADEVPLRVHLNREKGSSISFTPAKSTLIPPRDWAVSALALVDTDGDGALDLLLSTPGAADGVGLRLLLGGEDGFREAPERLPSSAGAPAAFAAGDVNGDGAVDLVLVGAGQDRLLLNDGSGHFFDATSSALPLDASSGTGAALVDLDRDRDLDLLIGNLGGEARLYLNDGSGRLLDHTPLLPLHADATTFLAASDVDGDADVDILVLNASPDPARLYLSVEPSPHEAP